MATCNIELIQGFLDGELEAGAEKELMAHLAGCTACRRELSRLKLLWLELAYPYEVEVPESLLYLRRQAVTAAMRQVKRSVEKELGFWESQKLVLTSWKYALAFLPGTEQLRGAAVTAARGVPDLLANSLSVAVRLWRKGRGGKP